jgi:hypothetical protein
MTTVTRVFLAILALPLAAAAGDDPAARFAAAHAAWAGGDAARAAELAEALHAQGLLAPESFLLLGNARAAEGGMVEAVLAWRRALVLDPALVEARQNLTLVLGRLGVAEPLPPPGWQAWLLALPRGWLVALTVGAGWSGLLLLAASRIWRPWLAAGVARRLAVAGVLLVAVPAAGGGVVLAARLWLAEPVANRAAVVAGPDGAEPVLRAEPARRAEAVVERLVPGSEVVKLAERGAWRYVECRFGEAAVPVRGWLLADSMLPVWPYDLALAGRTGA